MKYILAYNSNEIDAVKLGEHLKKHSKIKAYASFMPGLFFIISDENADKLCDELREKYLTTESYLLSELTTNYQGWLPKKYWEFLKNNEDKKEKPKGYDNCS